MKMSILYYALLLMFVVSNDLPTRSEEIRKLRFMPQWLPQAQFAGYYVAAQKGIYKKYGIDIELIKGGPDRPSSVYIKNNSADIVTMFLSTAIKLKSSGTDIINIGQMVKKSALILVSRKSSQINSPYDFENKILGIWGSDFSIQPLALLRKFGVQARIVPQSETVNLFLMGGMDIASAMLYNEYHLIINSGIDEDELKTFNYGDYGLNFPEDGIYILKSKFDEDPEFGCNFVKASIEGWEYSFNNIEESVDIVMDYMKKSNVSINRPHQIWMIKKMQEIMIINDDNKKISPYLDGNEFKNVANQLHMLNIIDNIPEYKDFFIDCSSDA